MSSIGNKIVFSNNLRRLMSEHREIGQNGWFPELFYEHIFLQTSSDLRYCYSIATLLCAWPMHIPAKFF